VRAILAGRKTQTRRAIKPQPADDIAPHVFPNAAVQGWRSSLRHAYGATTSHFCPFGQPGDRLWVRETWCHAWDDERDQWSDPERYHYRADGIEVVHVDDGERSPWCPSIHMPRRACRLLLEITDVRVERLQGISKEDCIAEGPDAPVAAHLERAWHVQFQRLWETTGGDWAGNPWVWAITFKRIEA
jgi:hypothetical protein